MSAYKDGTFLKDPESRGKPAANPMTDPAAMEGMMGMMKGNMAMMVPQTLIMGWINAFFAGFVVCKSSELLCLAGTPFARVRSLLGRISGNLSKTKTDNSKSKTPLPPNTPIQINAPVRRCNP